MELVFDQKWYLILDSRAVFIRGLSPGQGRVKVPGEKEGGGGGRDGGEEMEEEEGRKGGGAGMWRREVQCKGCLI